MQLRLACLSIALPVLVALLLLPALAKVKKTGPVYLTVDFLENATAQLGQKIMEGMKVVTRENGYVEYRLAPWKSINVQQYPCGELKVNQLRMREDGVVLRVTLDHWHPLTCFSRPSVRVRSKLLSRNSGIDLNSGESSIALYGTEVNLSNQNDTVTLGVLAGRATMKALGRSVTIDPGYFSIQEPGKPPTLPQPAPPVNFTSLEVVEGDIRACVEKPNRLLFQGRLQPGDCLQVRPNSEVVVSGPLREQTFNVYVKPQN